MDFATIIGIVSGFGLIIVSILMGPSPILFINMPSIIIVVGGTFAATLINYPLGQVLSILGPVRKAFFVPESDPGRLIQKLVELSIIARKEGILALERHVKDADDPFLANSIRLAIDGTAPDMIRSILRAEVASMESRHALGQAVLSTMGAIAPAFGMIGTLIGLVQMLSAMKDPSKIGPAMAIAMLTTLYGAIIAYVICIPTAGKLKVRTASELLAKEMTIEGILAIQSGDNPRIVEQKLRAFVAPDQRVDIVVAR
ncbi:MAG: MotA/TolQ/ExbB proton channel family protein [Candidatus Hydrogenedentota bacterium]